MSGRARLGALAFEPTVPTVRNGVPSVDVGARRAQQPREVARRRLGRHGSPPPTAPRSRSAGRARALASAPASSSSRAASASAAGDGVVQRRAAVGVRRRRRARALEESWTMGWQRARPASISWSRARRPRATHIAATRRGAMMSSCGAAPSRRRFAPSVGPSAAAAEVRASRRIYDVGKSAEVDRRAMLDQRRRERRGRALDAESASVAACRAARLTQAPAMRRFRSAVDRIEEHSWQGKQRQQEAARS